MEHTLGKRIVSHRKRLGLTQDQLAEQLGITAQAVSKWENDQSCPDITMLPRLSEIFGITIDALLGVEREMIHQGEVVVPENHQESKGNFELQWGGKRKDTLALAVLVLLVGGLMLAAHFLEWDVHFWHLLWPSALLIYGLWELFPKFGFWPLNCILFGGYFLARELGILPRPLMDGITFPLLLLLLGLSLLVNGLRKKPKKHHLHVHNHQKHAETFHTGEQDFVCETVFGENHRYIALPRLTAGRGDCSFGELTIDLSGCENISDDCHLTLSCSFGSITLLLPHRFRAELDYETAFGSVNIHGEPDPNAIPIAITCETAFGAVEIRYI